MLFCEAWLGKYPNVRTGHGTGAPDLERGRRHAAANRTPTSLEGVDTRGVPAIEESE